MKRIIVSVLLSAMLLTSCGVATESQSESSEQMVTTPPPVSSEIDKYQYSEQLAQLISEDNKGEITLYMSMGEVEDVLLKYNIPYEYDSEWDQIVCMDGTRLCDEFFELYQTKSGLRIGDSTSQAKKIYGEPDFEGESFYVYNTGVTPNGRNVELSLNFKDNAIWRICLDIENEEFVGGHDGIV